MADQGMQHLMGLVPLEMGRRIMLDRKIISSVRADSIDVVTAVMAEKGYMLPRSLTSLWRQLKGH